MNEHVYPVFQPLLRQIAGAANDAAPVETFNLDPLSDQMRDRLNIHMKKLMGAAEILTAGLRKIAEGCDGPSLVALDTIKQFNDFCEKQNG